MTKATLFPGLLVAALLLAGIYGAIHDQVSYTVSPDYFHAFKFRQFSVPPAWQGRVGAAWVGWQASWWMGFFVGLPILISGLILPDAASYLRGCLLAFAAAIATALLVGLTALLVAFWTIDANTLPSYWYPEQVADRVAFGRVGTMHNFSYLGGFLGILTGVSVVLLERFRPRR